MRGTIDAHPMPTPRFPSPRRLSRSRSLPCPGAVSCSCAGSRPGQSPSSSARGPWLEDGAPFFSSVLDARRGGRHAAGHEPLPARDRSGRRWTLGRVRPRPAARGCSVVRQGRDAEGAGAGLYHQPDRKTPGGQKALPEPDGPVAIANGIYPGWQVGERPVFEDPRPAAPSPEEIGSGPMPADQGRFSAVRLTREGAVLEYERGRHVRAGVDERRLPAAPTSVVRHVESGPPRRARRGCCSASRRRAPT